ncbi:GNAT family N-acetyltransferase [Pyrococcus abyssi]|uniref:Acetyl transferase n=1 Tax=Pyrococcus abyssi (strain GE5 / Orsay) TaxID=272844 RepID=Q9V1M6_PYRAB|nr:GNAT family protein [Pyrococcus abyssi]CAB49323.1 N-acetyltransferase,substrate unknown [Pyrococcus abyssi GE5]CCE69779.1 TPA: acetyl transferase [Pyrococcus abyssi GE5]
MVNNPMMIYFENDFDEILKELRKNREKMINFAVVENEKEELVGFCGIGDIDWRSRNAMVWYLIGKEHWGKGYGTETLALLCRFAFENMNLRKLYTHVYEPNRASIRVLEKNGFKLVGRLKKHVYLPDYGYVDELIYERFKD